MDLTLRATRDAFGDAIVSHAGDNKRIMALTADLAESLRLTKFAQLFPQRFIEVGVAEQNMMGIAAGLALDGWIPFAASFAVFSPGRNWDQLRVSVAYNNANVKIIGGYVGFSNGKDGATHQALEDIAITRVLPNLSVVDPADYYQTVQMMTAVVEHVGPVYIRIRRDPIQSLESLIADAQEKNLPGADKLIYDNSFKIGKGQILRNGSDVTIIACGIMVHEALKASLVLAQENIDAKVINMSSIKPIDRELILKSAQETGAIVTIEEHQCMGGLGSAVAEVIVQEYPVPMKIIGVNDQFGETGTQEELLQSRGLTAENICYNVKEVLKLKNKHIY